MHKGTSLENSMSLVSSLRRLSAQTARLRIALLRASVLATCCLSVNDTVEV